MWVWLNPGWSREHVRLKGQGFDPGDRGSFYHKGHLEKRRKAKCPSMQGVELCVLALLVPDPLRSCQLAPQKNAHTAHCLGRHFSKFTPKSN